MGEHARTAAMVEQLVDRLGTGPWPREAVLGAGWTPGQVRRAVEAGRLARPFRGVLAPPADRSGRSSGHRLSGQDLHTICGRMEIANDRAAVSHVSAAEWSGLWVPSRLDDLLHLTIDGVPDSRDAKVRIHGSSLPESLVHVVNGVRTTSPARTAMDVARGRTLPDALIALDGASRMIGSRGRGDRFIRTPEGRDIAQRAAMPRLQEAFESVRSWPGSVILRRALPLVDVRSESAFESWSRGWMVLDGLLAPEIGARVAGASGRDYFGDFVWREHRVVGEADGLGKYGVTERQIRDSLAAERHRQRDLEDAGWAVHRWDSRETPQTWLARLRRALGQSSHP